MAVPVLLGLGANLGDPLAQLDAAVERLRGFVSDLRCSSVYRTEPVGFRDQPDFYNLVCEGSTDLGAEELLRVALEVEAGQGRVRGIPNGPRSIDIDLLDYGGQVREGESLVLPHPRLHERAFVLVPLAELVPAWRHPVLALTPAELLAAAGTLERVELAVARSAPALSFGERSDPSRPRDGGRGDVDRELDGSVERVMTRAGETVLVEAASGSYEVRVDPGLLDRLPALLGEYCPAHRYAVISDNRVAALYGQRVVDTLEGAGVEAKLLTFPAGESHKTRAEWALLSDEMFAAKLGRDAAVLALGGGVTGDLAGFVAATYMRGLPLVQLPTTLLAMIDSSVGGKTGVDTPAGKNLVGAFLQPALVAADISTLRTLAPAEVRAGMAEAIKHGAIADEAYFHAIERDLPALLDLEPAALQRLIVRSVEIKAEVVARDEREAGQRKMLNFGHTLGHAVEALSGYRLLHGEAVAIGMVLESRLGERLGVTASGTTGRLVQLLSAAGLPTEKPEQMAPGAVLDATRSDKKARRGRVEYSLIEKIGVASAGPDGRWGWAVDDAAVEEILKGEE